MNTQENNMNIYNHYIGYGNPDSDYWFFGIEEYWKEKFNNKDDETEYLKKEKEKLNKVYKPRFDGQKPYFILGNDYKKNHSEFYEKVKIQDTYAGIIELYCRINGKNFEQIKQDEETTDDIINNKVFILNLFPLGKKEEKVDFGKITQELTGIRNFHEGYYKTPWYSDRKKLIASFIQPYLNSANKYIFCLGKKHWNEFEDVMKNAQTRDQIYEKFQKENEHQFKTNVLSGSLGENKIIYLNHPSRNHFKINDYLTKSLNDLYAVGVLNRKQ